MTGILKPTCAAALVIFYIGWLGMTLENQGIWTLFLIGYYGSKQENGKKECI